MKYFDSIRRAARGLTNARLRTVLTSLAIAVGAFTITLAFAAGAGVRTFIDSLIAGNVDPDSMYISVDYETARGDGGAIQEYQAEPMASADDAEAYTINQSTLDEIEALPEVKRVTPFYLLVANYVQVGDDGAQYVVTPAVRDPGVELDVLAGEMPPLGQDLAKGDAIISNELATTIVGDGDSSSLIGQQITVNVPSSDPTKVKDFRYTIVAVTEPSSLSFNTGSNLQLSAVDSAEMSEFNSEGTPMHQQYYGAIAIVADGVTQDSAKAAIEAVDDMLVVQTAEEVSAQIFQFVDILQYIVVGFGAISLVAAVFGIINTQYISVLERIREIGLMKALGMRGRHVRRLFQLEAAWIGFLGGVIGVLLAIVAGVLLNPWITESLSLPDGMVLLIFEPLPIVALVAALTLIAMFAGWFPSWKASGLDPIEALRTE